MQHGAAQPAHRHAADRRAGEPAERVRRRGQARLDRRVAEADLQRPRSRPASGRPWRPGRPSRTRRRTRRSGCGTRSARPAGSRPHAGAAPGGGRTRRGPARRRRASRRSTAASRAHAPGPADRRAGSRRRRPAPCRSRRGGATARPGRPRGAAASRRTACNAPTGTLIRKIERQPVPNRSRSISTPATIGPSTADRPETGPSTAHALLISSGGKRSRIRPKTCGSMTAPSGALERARADQELGRRGRRAQDGGDGEAGGADQQHPLAAEHVPEPPAGEQADGHRQRVRGRDPLQVGVRAAELGLHDRAGDARDVASSRSIIAAARRGREGDPRRLGDWSWAALVSSRTE